MEEEKEKKEKESVSAYFLLAKQRTSGSEKIKSRIIPPGNYQSIVKNISHDSSKDRIGRIIYKSLLKESVNKSIFTEVNKECNILCARKDASALRNCSSDHIATFSMENLNSEIQKKAPLLHGIFQNAVKGSMLGTQHQNRSRSCYRDKKDKIGELMLKEKDSLEKTGTVQDHKSSDIIGDNIDLNRSPSQMSIDRRRKSWHWFLLVGLQKRVLNPTLDDTAPISDITSVDNSTFIPNLNDCSKLVQNFMFRIMNVLVKYVGCLKKYKGCLPKFIPHPHLNELSGKSNFAILDMLDKSENKSEDMITILEHIHANFIPRTDDENPSVIKKKVFGGDVLTNERAYSAQLAMLNGTTDYERLTGVIHRPEGLHRMMNLLLFIYQIFYKSTSAGDKGTLFHLRNFISRIDVRGSEEVVQKYRSHYSFVEDSLDSYIVAAYLPALSARTSALDTQIRQIEAMHHNQLQKFVCEVCNKQYKTKGGIKKHLKIQHQWDFDNEQETPSKNDHIALYRASFMKCSLLLRDTNDVYKMGDGDRILLNAKFQMLLSRIGNHTKYQLWLFRFMAYCYSSLTPRMAYEYIWNGTANMHGNIGHNLPNDNLVEMLVQAVKKKIYAQGANATYKSA
ncbi:Hypothetical predicted protein [Mytilus galloprovincialis]|uniref:C2H2-type domain-containing protein n=1 Tax=Mytilus galloprovincialis TaxID=29158 RepID=A0A8B6H7Y5_MYTGA|nr:Hypothetical predicted protein [Mytilus galloprovincialis]